MTKNEAELILSRVSPRIIPQRLDFVGHRYTGAGPSGAEAKLTTFNHPTLGVPSTPQSPLSLGDFTFIKE
jgi:hypothetical protein